MAMPVSRHRFGQIQIHQIAVRPIASAPDPFTDVARPNAKWGQTQNGGRHRCRSPLPSDCSSYIFRTVGQNRHVRRWIRRSASHEEMRSSARRSCTSSFGRRRRSGFAPTSGQRPPIEAQMPAVLARRSLSRVPGKGFKHPVPLPGSTLADIACRWTVFTAQIPDFSAIFGIGSLRFHRSDKAMVSLHPSRSKRIRSDF